MSRRIYSLFVLLGALALFLVGLAALIIVCRQAFTPPKDTEVGIPAVIAYLALWAVFGQLIINRFQWQIMQDGLDETRSLSGHNERVLKAMNDQWAVMRDQESRMAEQRSIMQAQLDSMKKGLAQTRELFELVERPILTIEHAAIFINDRFNVISPEIVVVNKGRQGASEVRLYFRLGLGILFEPTFFEDSPTYAIPSVSPGDRFGARAAPADSLKVTPERGLEALLEPDIINGLNIFGRGSYKNMDGSVSYEIPEFVFRHYGEKRFGPDYNRAAIWKENIAIRREQDESGKPFHPSHFE